MQEVISALLLHRSEHCTYWHVHIAQPIMRRSCVHLHSVYRPLNLVLSAVDNVHNSSCFTYILYKQLLCHWMQAVLPVFSHMTCRAVAIVNVNGCPLLLKGRAARLAQLRAQLDAQLKADEEEVSALEKRLQAVRDRRSRHIDQRSADTAEAQQLEAATAKALDSEARVGCIRQQKQQLLDRLRANFGHLLHEEGVSFSFFLFLLPCATRTCPLP